MSNSKPKFTPGPWKVDGLVVFSPSERTRVALLDEQKFIGAVRVELPTEANAALIAAAPEMYAQLQRCLLNIQVLNDKLNELCPELVSGSSDTETMTRAILAKARGEE